MPRRTPILDLAATVTVVALFLTAQFGWLPLGILGGQAHYVPTWSKCGEALCDCTPTPYCPLCEDLKADPDATCMRLDLSGTRSQETVIALVDSLIALPVLADRTMSTLVPTPRYTRATAGDPAPHSRTLGVPAPPPRF